jgi:hypothetical protein
MNPSKQFESNPFIDANSFLREFQEHWAALFVCFI